MIRRIGAAAFAALFLLACSDTTTDAQREWAQVLDRKKAASSPSASAHEKQLYADTLGGFLKKHPKHSRARHVYERVQLDFARELAALGRYQDAIRFYRAVLRHDPANLEATQGLTIAVDRLAVSRDKLLALEKGMTQKQVAHILGKPIPGWRVVNDKRDPVVESWYYRTTTGGVAGVYFRGRVLFAAEERSNAKLSSLTR